VLGKLDEDKVETSRIGMSVVSIIFVNQQAAGGDGTSWQNAYRDLNSALANASNGDEIWVASGTYPPGTVRSDSFEIERGVSVYGGFDGTETNRGDRNITQNLTILSGDVGTAGKSYQVIVNQSSEQVRLDGIIVQGGDTTGSPNNSDGGGIYNQSGKKLLLENVIVQNNVASDDGGGIRNDGELIILNSTVANNQANGSDLTTGGGGLLNTVGATATIIGSTFSGNQSLRGGAIRNDDALTLINSTLSENAGGGLLNTTLNPLSATSTASRATIVNSTLTQNGGTGIDNFGSVTLANSLIAGNNSGDNDIAAFAFGTFTSNGNNLIGDRGTVTSFTSSDLVGDSTQAIDPLLGTLQNNGGFTQTHQPTETSPAANSGSDTLIAQDTLDLDGDGNTTEAIPFEQRGQGFERIFGSSVDIGAVEAGNATPSTDTSNTGNSTSSTSDSRYVKLSLRAAPSSENSSDFVLTVDEQGRITKVDANGLDLGGIEFSGIDLGSLDFGSLDFSNLDLSSSEENLDLFTDLFGEAKATLANLQLGSFDGLTLSRTQQIPDSVRSSLTGVLSAAISRLSQSELNQSGASSSLLDSTLLNNLLDSLIEQIQERGSQISFQLNSSNPTFQNLVLLAELSPDGPSIGSGLQGLNEPELIDLRNISNPLTATFEVYREANFDNQVGFFEIEDVTGQVLDAQGNLLGVSDDGYVLAAMQKRLDTNLSTQNGQMSTYTAEISGGKLLSSFIISNGSIEDLLDDNAGNDPTVYFSHTGSNNDSFDHVRLLGDNTFGYEDTAGGGDQDFNDLIIKSSFA